VKFQKRDSILIKFKNTDIYLKRRVKFVVKMHKELIRIGTENLVNRSELYKSAAFDLLFGGNYEFVYLPDYNQLMNETTGAMAHLMNDT
jgi:hypothetical protein